MVGTSDFNYKTLYTGLLASECQIKRYFFTKSNCKDMCVAFFEKISYIICLRKHLCTSKKYL